MSNNHIDLNNVKISPATLDDHLVIRNMARFYVYDLSRECGFISKDWALPEDGLYESFDFKIYFTASDRKAFIIKIADELVGFVLLNQEVSIPDAQWSMGEFFILAKFQGKGIAKYVAHRVWNKHPGKWEVLVLPENISALGFWRKAIREYTNNEYNEELKTVRFDQS
jgi:predicted acetyltransferase